MRRSVASGLVFVLVLALSTSGCEDRVIYAPAPAENSPTGNPPAGNPPLASFTSDGQGTMHGVLFSGWSSPGRDRLSLFIEPAWATHPTSADLLLHVDPGAHAEVVGEAGSWCGAQAGVVPTDQPGEWRIQRSPGVDDCGCFNPNPNVDGYDWGAFALARVTVIFHQPGTWNVALLPGSATPSCDCESGCPTDLFFDSGTASIPAS